MPSFAPLALACTLICASAAQAQTPPKPVKAPAKAAPAKKPTAPAPVELPEATPDQLMAAERAYLGDYVCDAHQAIHIAPLASKAGYITVVWNKQSFTMKPVLSSTGALRLEDVTGRTLMIQIANKSMLLDTKIGQRLVDDCVHPEQIKAMAAAKAAAAANPDAAAQGGLGINK